MCLVVVALEAVPGHPLVLAANRDEAHERPAHPLGWWPDWPEVAGGRDLRAGGTWLAAHADGRFALVLNGRGEAAAAPAPSRGELVARFLRAERPEAALERIAGEGERYAGFHLVAGTDSGVWYLTNTGAPAQAMGPGVHVVDNAGLDQPDPRSRRARAAFPLEGAADAESVLAFLGDERAPGAGAGDDRPLFIRDPRFGTRCSTVLQKPTAGWNALRERRFDPAGAAVGEVRFAWPRRPHAPGGR